MAKSIRSKRKRMLRNIKRERYAKKDLEKLKQMVALAEKDKDTEMKELYTGINCKKHDDLLMASTR